MLKRIKRGTETSISGGLNSSQELAEDYFKSAFRVQKPKLDTRILDKENYKINYSDIIQLQKGLRPIASYNESKMITRYST